MRKLSAPFLAPRSAGLRRLAASWVTACVSLLSLALPVLARGDGAATPADKNAKTQTPVEDPEIKMGRENAEENDKAVKLVTDAAMVERVNRIGQEIATVANKYEYAALWGDSHLKHFNYSFKVIDDKDVNAYSLPGGYIYVYKGLLNYVHSDDELAGVLAHEITHAAHHHMVHLLHEQNKIDREMLPLKLAALVALFSKGNGGGGQRAYDAQNLLLSSQLISIAKLNGYGVQAEKDADHGGILLLTHTHYNPVGLYSFLLRETVDEHLHGNLELGIFRNHPPGEERVQAAKALLDELHIPINISEVDPKLRPAVVVTKLGLGGADLAEIRINSVLICRVAAAENLTAQQNAERIAQRLSSLIYDNRPLQPFEIKVSLDQTRVTARRLTILTAADAAAQQKPLTVLAREMSDALSQCIINRAIETGQ